jgi:outer membrane protein assembly factor BamB
VVVIGTSDCNRDATPPYHEAVLALDTESGVLRWAFRPRTTDTCDFDFGASPNILEIGHKRYVGIGGKDGTYYLLRSNTNNPAGQLLWSTNVVFGGYSGGFIGSTAFDDARIYGGTGYGDLGGALCDPSNPRDTPVQEPSFHAFDLRNGTIEWERSLNYTFAAPTVGDAVVFDGWAGLGDAFHPSLRAYDARSGREIASLEMPGQVNSSATITGNMIFVGTGNSFDGGGSSVQALILPDFMVNKNAGESQKSAGD